MVGHAWSWIFLRKRQEREIYVSFSIQERTSQRKDLSSSHYFIQIRASRKEDKGGLTQFSSG